MWLCIQIEMLSCNKTRVSTFSDIFVVSATYVEFWSVKILKLCYGFVICIILVCNIYNETSLIKLKEEICFVFFVKVLRNITEIQYTVLWIFCKCSMFLQNVGNDLPDYMVSSQKTVIIRESIGTPSLAVTWWSILLLLQTITRTSAMLGTQGI
jgi:hypothetical protein